MKEDIQVVEGNKIIEGNKLIALFDGWICDDNGNWKPLTGSYWKEFKDKEFLGQIAISPDIDIWHSYTVKDLAKNDGLEFEDFKEWFKKYNFNEPMAIIHFTEERY